MNMPRFTAEESLGTSKSQYKVAAGHHSQNRTMLLQHRVVPQLPISVGRVCDFSCGIRATLLGAHRICRDFTCDLQSFDCDFGPAYDDIC